MGEDQSVITLPGSDVPPGEAEHPAARADRRLSWDQAIQLVGALAGFAALGYAVGATELWMRFATTGFPADVALAVVSRERILVIGFRSLLTWCVISALLLAGVVFLRRRGGQMVPPTFRAALARTTHGHGGRLAIAFGSALLVASAFLTWSAFTVVGSVLACVIFYRFYCRRYRAPPRPWFPVLLFIAVLSAIASIGWQLQVNLTYDSALITLKGERVGRMGIYFGTDGSMLYASRRVTPDAQRGRFSRKISVIRLDDVRSVSLLEDGQTLCTNVPSPAQSLRRALHRLDRLVRQHLRPRGTPDPIVHAQPRKVPPGQCPPQ
jgi:hypothetical protein